MKAVLMMATIAVMATAGCIAQERKRASPHETISNEHVSVTYGRPYAKGRQIFGGLIKYGEVWRTGADEATEITFKKDGSFAGKPVKAGTYTLFTIPAEGQWTVILNPELKQWGAYGYDKIKDKNMLEATVPAGTGQMTEQLTLSLEGNNLVIAWDKTRVSIPMQF